YLESYDPNQPEKYIIYIDANNLYGNAMSEELPTGDFKFASREIIDSLTDINSLNDYFKKLRREYKGCVLVVDLKYPKELHDSHNDLPFCPQQVEMNGNRKLIPNLYDKKDYVIHYKNLLQALDAGLELESIKQIITFKQSDW